MPRALHVFTYCLRLYRRTWKGTFVISVVNPLLFLLGVGVGIGHLVSHGHPATLGGVSYEDFFAPGLLAAAAMQTAFVEAGGRVTVAAGASGAYRSATTTPLEPEDILLGHMLFVAFRVLTSTAAFIAVMELFGTVSGWWVIVLWPAAVLSGIAFAVPLAAWTVTLRRYTQVNSFFRFLFMPMYMFSGTFFALGELPHVVRLIVSVLPLTQGVDLCRGLSLGHPSAGGIAAHAAYLALLLIGGGLAARVTYRRRLHA